MKYKTLSYQNRNFFPLINGFADVTSHRNISQNTEAYMKDRISTYHLLEKDKINETVKKTISTRVFQRFEGIKTFQSYDIKIFQNRKTKIFQSYETKIFQDCDIKIFQSCEINGLFKRSPKQQSRRSTGGEK